MPRSQPHELENFLGVLTQRIHADLPSWYGQDATLDGAPTIHPRPWSCFFRYTVRISTTENRAILVKVRRLEKMSVEEAITNVEMKQEIREEYKALVQIQRIFNVGEEAQQFFTVRPLACYEDLNSLVEEEASIHSLKSILRTPSIGREEKSWRVFEQHLSRAGRWLRIFHDHLGVAKQGPFVEPLIAEEMYENLGWIERPSNRKDVQAARRTIEAICEKYSDTLVPYRTLHHDFSLANIFVTDDRRICSFDPHNKPGPIYRGLAKPLMDLETERLQVFTGGLFISSSRMSSLSRSLLEGYFGTDTFTPPALNFYRLARLIKKWAENERKYQNASPRRKVVFAVGMLQMRGYYLRLLRSLIAEQEITL